MKNTPLRGPDPALSKGGCWAVGGRAEKKGPKFLEGYSHRKLTCLNGKSPFLIGDISSNGCFSIVILVFRGVFFLQKV